MKKYKDRIISTITALLIIFMVVTMVRAASFSVLVADDYSHGINIGAFHVPLLEYLKASIAYSKTEYLNWQGTYSAMFIQALLSPINNYGFRQLRCVMAINALLFYASLIILVWTGLGNKRKENRCVNYLIIAIIVFCFCGYQTYPEVFFWFSGAASYSFPLSFLLLALSFFWISYEKKSIMSLIGSTLLGIVAMGGSLTVSGVGCFTAFLICLYACLSAKRIPLSNVFVMGIWVIFAGVNAMAPGNYVRHSVIDDSGIHPWNALYDAINMSSIRWNYFFKSTNLVFILSVLFIIGLLLGKKHEQTSNNKSKIIVSALGLLAPLVTAFPVALGYSAETIPDRCAFMIDVSIVLSATNLALLLGKEICAYIDMDQKRVFMITIAIIASTVFMLDGFGISDIKVRQLSRGLADGVYKDYYYACKKFSNSLQDYEKGEDVRISNEDFPQPIDDVYSFYLSDDPTHWVNQAVSRYYGFNSIAVYY